MNVEKVCCCTALHAIPPYTCPTENIFHNPPVIIALHTIFFKLQAEGENIQAKGNLLHQRWPLYHTVSYTIIIAQFKTVKMFSLAGQFQCFRQPEKHKDHPFGLWFACERFLEEKNGVEHTGVEKILNTEQLVHWASHYS